MEVIVTATDALYTAHLYGDSIATGAGASGYSASFAGLLSSQFPSQFNHGVSTAMAVDQWDAVWATAVAVGGTSIVFDGTNDQACYDTDVSKRGYFIDAQRATAVRLTAEWKPATPANVTFTGSWSNAFAWGSYGTNSPGAKATFVAESSRVVIGMIRQKNNTSSFRVRIAGVDKGVFQTGGDLTTLLGRSYGPYALSFATSPGHIVEISVVSASSGNDVMFQWFSSCVSKARAIFCNIPHAVNYTYGGSDANVDAYNSALLAEINTLASYGLDVQVVDVCSLLTVSNMHDDVHPNDSGHMKIYQALLGVL